MDKEQLIKLGKAIEYMRDHYQSPIKVNEIAEYAGLTPKALNRIMSEKYGYTFAVLLRKYRLYIQSLTLIMMIKKLQWKKSQRTSSLNGNRIIIIHSLEEIKSELDSLFWRQETEHNLII